MNFCIEGNLRCLIKIGSTIHVDMANALVMLHNWDSTFFYDSANEIFTAPGNDEVDAGVQGEKNINGLTLWSWHQLNGFAG